MAYKIVVSKVAQRHISEAVSFYQKHASREVANEFYSELQSCYELLEMSPYFQVRIKTYRAIQIKNFPFLVFFEINESNQLVRILAIFNTHRDSRKWP